MRLTRCSQALWSAATRTGPLLPQSTTDLVCFLNGAHSLCVVFAVAALPSKEPGCAVAALCLSRALHPCACVVVRAYIMRRDEPPETRRANKERAVALAKEVVALAEKAVEEEKCKGDGAAPHCCLTFFLMCSRLCLLHVVCVRAVVVVCCLFVRRSFEVFPWCVQHEQVSGPQAFGQRRERQGGRQVCCKGRRRRGREASTGNASPLSGKL
jgi:hypothetical protein